MNTCVGVGVGGFGVGVAVGGIGVWVAVGGFGVGVVVGGACVVTGAPHPTKSKSTSVIPVICCNNFW